MSSVLNTWLTTTDWRLYARPVGAVTGLLIMSAAASGMCCALSAFAMTMRAVMTTDDDTQPEPKRRYKPYGLLPRHRAEMNYCLERCIEITEANHRYVMAGWDVPESWASEYRELRTRYMKLEKTAQSRKSDSR